MLDKLFALSVFLAAPASATVFTTGDAGAGLAFANYQPSLVLNQRVQTTGVFPCRECSGAGAVIGMVRSFGYSFGTNQALGQLLPIASNTPLFSILGTTYGGDGRTTFALPDLAGRTIIGAGQGPGLAAFDLGGVYGSASVTLTETNLPNHSHGLPGGGVTSAVGGGQGFDNMQPSLALNYLIQTEGIFPSSASAPAGGGLGDFGGTPAFTGNNAYIGQIGLFAGNFAPGWMIADGSVLSIAQNTALFAIIGTTYGGNGVTTFALPDLRGRTALGVGQGPGLDSVVLGQQLGAATTAIALSQMPLHDHDLVGGGTTGPAGASVPVDQRQAGLGINYLVALQGIFPSQTGPLGQDTELGEIIAFAGNYAPRGFAFAHGQLLSIAQNQALFALFGTQFGGDGRVTFALPDLRGRTMLGQGAGFAVGDRFGVLSTTLTEANLPTHAHTYTVANGAVPEPTTWALLILGFGIVGRAMRRRGMPAFA